MYILGIETVLLPFTTPSAWPFEDPVLRKPWCGRLLYVIIAPLLSYASPSHVPLSLMVMAQELLLRAGAELESKDYQLVTPIAMASAQEGAQVCSLCSRLSHASVSSLANLSPPLRSQERLLALSRQSQRRVTTSVVGLSMLGLATGFVMLSRFRV